MRIDAIFPVALLEHNVTDELADKVEEIYLQNIDKMEHSPAHYGDFFRKEGRVLNIQTDTPDLFKEILNCRATYIHETGLDSSEGICEFWTQDYRDPGQHHRRHCHGIHGISGVYWIRANENAQPLTFYNPNSLTSYARYQKDTAFSFIEFNVMPEKGKMVLFPSYLEHEVQQSGPDVVRTTLAFNFPWAEGLNLKND